MKILISTNGKLLNNYKKSSDKYDGIKNFRLFYKNKPTNLIWYDGKIIFLPKEYFELRNLVNVDINKKQKCSLFSIEVNLVQELKRSDFNFLMDNNLQELIRRIELSGIPLFDNVSIELIDDNNYKEIHEPIYLGDGYWLNFNEKTP